MKKIGWWIANAGSITGISALGLISLDLLSPIFYIIPNSYEWLRVGGRVWLTWMILSSLFFLAMLVILNFFDYLESKKVRDEWHKNFIRKIQLETGGIIKYVWVVSGIIFLLSIPIINIFASSTNID